jgi:hypothetical protein
MRNADAEVNTLKRIANLLEKFDLPTRRRMLWWLVWREGELPAELGHRIADLINGAPVPTPELPVTTAENS